jgi:hypothetical protein
MFPHTEATAERSSEQHIFFHFYVIAALPRRTNSGQGKRGALAQMSHRSELAAHAVVCEPFPIVEEAATS